MDKRFVALPAFAPTFVIPEASVNGKSYSNLKNVLGGLVIGFVVLFVCCLLCLCVMRYVVPYHRRRRGRIGSLDSKRILLRRFQLEELEKATNKFSQDCLIGSGGFGNVYRGNFDIDGTLAIKKAHANSYQSVPEFRNEVMLVSKVKHRNLVSLVGFCEESGAEGSKILIYEYVPNGSLLEYIMGRSGKHLTWRQRVNVAIGAAKGIAHLHEGIKPSIIHRDIKPSNILLGHGFEAKVSDFGLVKTGPVGDKSHVSSQIKGTPGYLDPAYCTTLHLSPFSDVYSFGVILLQLISARPAVDTTRNSSNNHIVSWARPSLEQGNIEEIIDANLLLEQCNMEIMLKMGQLGLKCVVPSPKERPTMTQVWQELETSLYDSDNFIHQQPSTKCSRKLFGEPRISREFKQKKPMDQDFSESFVSIDGIGLQRFHVEMDSLSFQSTSLRCLESDSVSVDVDKNGLRGIYEETSTEEESLRKRGH